jgi:ferric-dicitrate binding protein FerR (iron transport regulator)
MEYTDEDIAFAFRLLNERETLDDQVVEEWMRSPVHRRLMNEMEGVRQQWEREAAGGDEARHAREKEEQAARRVTLRRVTLLVIAMIVLLVVYRVARGG